MKKTIILSLLALTSLSISCTKLEPTNQKTPEEYVAQEFTASREALVDADSKAIFNGTILKWQVGDEIAINDGTRTSIFTATKVVEDVATFVLKSGEEVLDEGVTYKAYYPTYLAPKNGVITYPQVQKASNGETPSGKTVNYSPNIYSEIPMYAETTTSEIHFKNLTGLIKITMSLPGGATDMAFSQIIAQTDTRSLYGTAEINDGKLVITQTPGEGKEYGRIAIGNKNAKWVSAVQDYYISIPEGEYNDFEFIPQTNQSLTQIRRLKAGKTLKVERNKIYSYSFLADDLRTDLSYNRHTANCYAFAKKGNYMFRATRGNEKNIISGIDHADVVWRAQTWESTGAGLAGKIVDKVSYKSGYITFDANGSQANALIAAYDADGKVLWSWHIWSLNSERPLDDVTINGVTMLDRNLGALYATTYPNGSYETSVLSSGYLYQWGRKDPFPGRGQEGSGGAMIKMFDKDGNVLNAVETSGQFRATALPLMTGPVTVAESVENPAKFISVATANTHWASDIANTWGGDSKTIYDPCPYGYRVPSSDDFVDMWNAEHVAEYSALSGSGKTSLHGFTYSDGTNSSFFSITGQANNSKGTLSGAYMGTNSSTTSKVEAFSRLWTREGNHTIMQAQESYAAGKTWANRTKAVSFFPNTSAYGMAVRCVKETTE